MEPYGAVARALVLLQAIVIDCQDGSGCGGRSVLTSRNKFQDKRKGWRGWNNRSAASVGTLLSGDSSYLSPNFSKRDLKLEEYSACT